MRRLARSSAPIQRLCRIEKNNLTWLSWRGACLVVDLLLGVGADVVNHLIAGWPAMRDGPTDGVEVQLGAPSNRR